MKKAVLISMMLIVIAGCETINEAGQSIATAVDNLGDNSKRAAKDIGDAGNDFVEKAKSGGGDE